MLVAQVDLERPGARQPAGGLRAFQFDEKRRNLAPTLGSSNRNWVAHKPKIATGIILRRKDASGFRPPHHADQVGLAGGRPGGPRRRILSSLRHEASIDDDDPAGRDLSWREYPIAGSGHIAAQGRAADGTNAAENLTRRNSSLAGVRLAQRSRAGRSPGGEERRCWRLSMSASFQALRWSCQLPSPMKVATATSAT